MRHAFEDQVRLRAYEIWTLAGMTDGMAHDHWVRAEQAILKEHAKPATGLAKAAPRATKASTPVKAGPGKLAAKTAASKPEKKPVARSSKAKAGTTTN